MCYLLKKNFKVFQVNISLNKRKEFYMLELVYILTFPLEGGGWFRDVPSGDPHLTLIQGYWSTGSHITSGRRSLSWNQRIKTLG